MSTPESGKKQENALFFPIYSNSYVRLHTSYFASIQKYSELPNAGEWLVNELIQFHGRSKKISLVANVFPIFWRVENGTDNHLMVLCQVATISGLIQVPQWIAPRPEVKIRFSKEKIASDVEVVEVDARTSSNFVIRIVLLFRLSLLLTFASLALSSIRFLPTPLLIFPMALTGALGGVAMAELALLSQLRDVFLQHENFCASTLCTSWHGWRVFRIRL